MSDRPPDVPATTISGVPELLEEVENDLRRLMGERVRLQRDLADHARERERHDRAQLLSLLEIADALQRVFAAVEARPSEVTPLMAKWVGNFKTVRRMLDGLLRREGVVPIDVLGDQFDPAWQRILRTVADPTRPEGTIIEVTNTGYLWKNQVLRETEVVVVGPAESECPDEAASTHEAGQDTAMET